MFLILENYLYLIHTIDFFCGILKIQLVVVKDEFPNHIKENHGLLSSLVEEVVAQSLSLALVVVEVEFEEVVIVRNAYMVASMNLGDVDVVQMNLIGHLVVAMEVEEVEEVVLGT